MDNKKIRQCFIEIHKLPNTFDALNRGRDLDRNIKSVHEEKKSFKCNICAASFASRPNMKRHIGRVHEGKNHSNVMIVVKVFLKKEI